MRRSILFAVVVVVCLVAAWAQEPLREVDVSSASAGGGSGGLGDVVGGDFDYRMVGEEGSPR
jgi:hypothetical protein